MNATSRAGDDAPTANRFLLSVRMERPVISGPELLPRFNHVHLNRFGLHLRQKVCYGLQISGRETRGD